MVVVYHANKARQGINHNLVLTSVIKKIPNISQEIGTRSQRGWLIGIIVILLFPFRSYYIGNFGFGIKYDEMMCIYAGRQYLLSRTMHV
jgi:hypothetical protein